MTNIELEKKFSKEQEAFLQDMLASIEMKFEKDAAFSHKVAKMLSSVRQWIRENTKNEPD